MKINEAVTAYLAHQRLTRANVPRWLQQKETILQSFAGWAEREGLASIDSLEPRHLDAFLSSRSGGRSWATLSRYAVVVRKVVRWAGERGHVTPGPLAKLKLWAPPYQTPEIPPHASFVAMIRREPLEEPGDFFTVALFTGLRRGELMALRWLDVRGDYLMVRSGPTNRTKSGKSRTVPICGVVAAIFARRREYGGAGPFIDRQGRPIFSAGWISRRWKACARAHGLDLPLHSLRHAFCTYLLHDLGADCVSVQHAMGHASITTTQLYCHPGANLAQNLARLIDQKTATA